MDLLSMADAILGIITNIFSLIGLLFGACLFVKGRRDRKAVLKGKNEDAPIELQQTTSNHDRDAAE